MVWARALVLSHLALGVLLAGTLRSAADQRERQKVGPTLAEQGRTLYSTHCVGCHLPSGQGNPPLIPALAGNDALSDVGDVVRMVRQGRGIMPAFKQLEPAEIAAVVAYIRASWGNAFEPPAVSPVERLVRELDAATMSRATPEGRFSEEQASRGRELYLQHCAECHGADFVPDDFAPGLTGAAFDWRWKDRTVYDLFTAIRTTMPPAEEGTIGPQATIDIVSYLLEANGFSPGRGTLAPESEILQRLSLKR